ncbi:ATP-dependent helicase [Campylobacter ureolyticus]|uniref:ATP-dependent helicase n=1 Tax=Campylobacter ureolyticus TaxID=827 RepID=UPI0022B53359|nr:UvrD-helicase domain-containing protein [Campylobacter ureolyticus]MCZ6155767.1 UvrD-helicase domain-containing protein [Campylobacter ureolyticus]MCZ6171033.1 UvrD-helicase domain-containing protein [Campylobacter ureolyticus]
MEESLQSILQGLNEEQKKAATHVDGAMLILAGAGSGKTKTITSRLAYLISQGIPANSTLTLTFTNKAALEMRNRALNLINQTKLDAYPLLCTFHKFGLLFLKFYMSELKRKNNFVIIDTDDKKKIIKKFQSDLSTSILANEISKMKNSLVSVDDALSNSTLINDYAKKESGFYQKVAKVYKEYEDTLKNENLVDFDDLLGLPYKILAKNRTLCEEISQKYRYIMVDEYQDTNELQFKLLEKLCLMHENLCVVGDDDQSIYGWRGARVENILNFKDQFKNVTLIKLENNYRSTQNILNTANNLIDCNQNRLGKKLIGTKEKGEEVTLMESEDENYETNKISNAIKKLINSGEELKNIAVLYRVNALSRALEDGLTKARIPYKMVGGMKFYERAEIKDMISYIRLILNPNDDFSLRRIINRPKRGVGAASLEKLENIAKNQNLPLFETLNNTSNLGKKSQLMLTQLYEDILELKEKDNFYDIINELDETFKLKEFYKELPEGDDKIANIDEFLAMLKDALVNEPNFDLEEFLNELSLQSEQDNISEDGISIMSVHASKGLEFNHLFVIGMEEGFFPLIGDHTDIEEERRLAYVAITRAKKTLTLSYSNSRFYKGKRQNLDKSRFLSESGLCESALVFEKSTSFKKGDLVKHKLFGIGRVTNVGEYKNELKLSINFGGIHRDIISSFVEKVV